MANIGEEEETIIVEPMPTSVPIVEPSPTPAPVREPERVPA